MMDILHMNGLNFHKELESFVQFLVIRYLTNVA
jgi:hypothetical protein